MCSGCRQAHSAFRYRSGGNDWICLPTRSADLHNERRRALVEGPWVFRFGLRLGVVGEAGNEDQHEQDRRGDRHQWRQLQHEVAEGCADEPRRRDPGQVGDQDPRPEPIQYAWAPELSRHPPHSNNAQGIHLPTKVRMRSRHREGTLVPGAKASPTWRPSGPNHTSRDAKRRRLTAGTWAAKATFRAVSPTPRLLSLV